MPDQTYAAPRAEVEGGNTPQLVDEDDDEIRERDESEGEDDSEEEESGGTRPRRTAKAGQKPTRKSTASLKICSLNIKGRGANSIYDERHKWHDVNRVIRNERINVLGVQETHLTKEQVHEIQEFYGKTMRICASMEDGVTNSCGVAIVVNKSITNISDMEEHEIIPGRALMVTIHWHGLLRHSILVTYAPAEGPSANRLFWLQLREKMRELDLPSPDTHLGDHNFVEDAIDRNPAKGPTPRNLNAFLRFKNEHLLVDGWRDTNPDTKAYSFMTHEGRRSRIDRIYVSRDSLKNSHSWVIKKSGIPTDHDMVGYTLTAPQLPYVGPGRWAIPLYLIDNKKLDEQVNDKGVEVLGEMVRARDNRTSDNNPQSIWIRGKYAITEIYRKHAKKNVPRLERVIKETESKLDAIENDATLSEDAKTISATLLRQELDNLQRQRVGLSKKTAQARFHAEGEEVGKYWSSINKKKAPREIIYRLREPGSEPAVFATRSDKMADLARNYHEDLQKTGLGDIPTHEEAIED
ncbi:Endonuclease/exonuclease/phosphatase, partial [Schizophyllum commune]